MCVCVCVWIGLEWQWESGSGGGGGGGVGVRKGRVWSHTGSGGTMNNGLTAPINYFYGFSDQYHWFNNDVRIITFIENMESPIRHKTEAALECPMKMHQPLPGLTLEETWKYICILYHFSKWLKCGWNTTPVTTGTYLCYNTVPWKEPGPRLNIKTVFPGVAILIIKIWRS